jgi:UDP-GlcNAc:undecaprenyl-phosphate/decaprenyl-phosphate GlcNAc-1-phosphate transferase
VSASAADVFGPSFYAYGKLFIAAFAVTFVATPLVRRFVVAAGAIDHPSDRRVHPKATPTMGGLAMYAGFLAALALSRFIPFFKEVNEATPEPLAALVGCTLMVGLGAIDDTRGTTPISKITAQIFIAGAIVLFGVQFAYFWFPFVKNGPVVLSGDLPAILTIAWVVVVANAVNLVDGLDGLAAGMVAIASSALFFYVVRSPSLFGEASQAALLSAITAGICLGFLPWNFYPAKIFMGDTGSMLLGMLLAIVTVSGVGRNPLPPSTDDLVAIAGTIAVLLLVLAIPFLDVVLAIIRRTWRGQGIGHADKEHLHHRLMDIGHGHRQAVLLMYLWSALISGCGLVVGLVTGRLLVGVIIAGAATLFVVTAFPRLASPRNGARAAGLRVLESGATEPDAGGELTTPGDGDLPSQRRQGTTGGFPPAAP